MKKNKKREAIKDQYGQRVIIDTIAAYKCTGQDLVTSLRSGAVIRMSWANGEQRKNTIKRLDSFFNFGGETY